MEYMGLPRSHSEGGGDASGWPRSKRRQRAWGKVQSGRASWLNYFFLTSVVEQELLRIENEKSWLIYACRPCVGVSQHIRTRRRIESRSFSWKLYSNLSSSLCVCAHLTAKPEISLRNETTAGNIIIYAARTVPTQTQGHQSNNSCASEV